MNPPIQLFDSFSIAFSPPLVPLSHGGLILQAGESRSPSSASPQPFKMESFYLPQSCPALPGHAYGCLINFIVSHNNPKFSSITQNADKDGW